MADDEFTIDTSEFDRAIADLSRAPVVLLPKVRSAVQVFDGNVKDSWRDKLFGNEYAPRVPYSITYDTKVLARSVESEIGAEKGTGKQGGVALLLEYGAPRRGLSARGYGAASLAENLPDFEKGIGIALADSMKEVGW